MNESLTADESEAVLIALSQRISANLPLNTALAALADESTSPRAQRVLLDLNHQLESGNSPDLIIGRLQERLPIATSSLLQDGLQMGRMDLLMQSMVRQKQWDRDFRHRILIGLAYPTVILDFFGLWLLALLVGIVPQFKSTYESFGISLPGTTRLLIVLSDVVCGHGHWVIPLILLTVVAGWHWLVFGRLPRKSRRSLFVLPIIGPLLSLREFSEFCETLAILVEGQLPLPKALRFASTGLFDPGLKTTYQHLATLLEHGDSIESAANRLELPHSISLVLRQSPDEMARNLRALSSVYATKGDFAIRSVIIAIDVSVMLAISLIMVMTIGGLFMPLIYLVNGLS